MGRPGAGDAEGQGGGALRLSPESFAPLAEDLQVVHYGPGQQFKCHHDSAACEGASKRDVTLLVYLNDVPAGGETAFPAAAAAAAAVEEKQEDRRSEGTWELEGAQRGSNGEKKFLSDWGKR